MLFLRFVEIHFPYSLSLIYDYFTESTHIECLSTTHVAILYRLQYSEIIVSLSPGLFFREKNMCIPTIISFGSFGTLLRLKCYACKKKKKIDSNKWHALNFPFYCVFIHFLILTSCSEAVTMNHGAEFSFANMLKEIIKHFTSSRNITQGKNNKPLLASVAQ